MLRSGRVCKPSDTSEESTEGEDYEESGEDDETQEANDELEQEEMEGKYSTTLASTLTR